MTDYDLGSEYRRENRDTMGRFVAYLKTRRAETWVFFAAGLIVGTIIG